MALRRVIIMRNASSITASAMPRVFRVMVVASVLIGWANPKAKITKPNPKSMVTGTLTNNSLSHSAPSRRISLWSIQGSMITLRTSVSAAE